MTATLLQSHGIDEVLLELGKIKWQIVLEHLTQECTMLAVQISIDDVIPPGFRASLGAFAS